MTTERAGAESPESTEAEPTPEKRAQDPLIGKLIKENERYRKGRSQVCRRVGLPSFDVLQAAVEDDEVAEGIRTLIAARKSAPLSSDDEVSALRLRDRLRDALDELEPPIRPEDRRGVLESLVRRARIDGQSLILEIDGDDVVASREVLDAATAAFRPSIHTGGSGGNTPRGKGWRPPQARPAVLSQAAYEALSPEERIRYQRES
jgi:hypothetical protein